MSKTNPLIRHVVIDDHVKLHDAYYWWCPGCALWAEQNGGYHAMGTHLFHIPPWTFDGNMEQPTFEASYLSYGFPGTDKHHGAPRCHSFVRAGRIQYLGDCEHPLANQTVDMVPLPDWLIHD